MLGDCFIRGETLFPLIIAFLPVQLLAAILLPNPHWVVLRTTHSALQLPGAYAKFPQPYIIVKRSVPAPTAVVGEGAVAGASAWGARAGPKEEASPFVKSSDAPEYCRHKTHFSTILAGLL